VLHVQADGRPANGVVGGERWAVVDARRAPVLVEAHIDAAGLVAGVEITHVRRDGRELSVGHQPRGRRAGGEEAYHESHGRVEKRAYEHDAVGDFDGLYGMGLAGSRESYERLEVVGCLMSVWGSITWTPSWHTLH
jgi:hypothetical protein